MEFFDIVDEHGIPTGKTVSRKEAHANGIQHRTAQIWVVRTHEGKAQALMQKRLATKESYPNCYDVSAAGHIQAGEDPLISALRELEEELGIHAEPEELKFQGIHSVHHEEVFHGKLFKDREIGFVYIYNENVDIEQLILQRDEVDSAHWFDLSEIVEKVKSRTSDCCVPYGSMCLLQQWFEKQGNAA